MAADSGWGILRRKSRVAFCPYLQPGGKRRPDLILRRLEESSGLSLALSEGDDVPAYSFGRGSVAFAADPLDRGTCCLG
jgi:hypothetical protein